MTRKQIFGELFTDNEIEQYEKLFTQAKSANVDDMGIINAKAQSLYDVGLLRRYTEEEEHNADLFKEVSTLLSAILNSTKYTPIDQMRLKLDFLICQINNLKDFKVN